MIIAVIGLGYVGIPLAVAFAQKTKVIGFDVNRDKVDAYLRGEDPTDEVGGQAVLASGVHFTTDEAMLDRADVFIIAVPTPINLDKTPNLFQVESASAIVGRHLRRGGTVIYESTVYPGVTEDICIPILEKESGLLRGADFMAGYSPERINPGDRTHRLQNIVKIVSGIDKASLEKIQSLYEMVVEEVYPVSSIKTAEAAKVVENSQRDINIAFMNELAMVFDRMGIDSREVVDAMNTKWNALGFMPGLVGGHCIGVDPYYFIYQAEKLGYHSQIILAGRKINDDMSRFVADEIIRSLIKADKKVKGARVAILGVTFKENCSDCRNTKVVDIVSRLREYDIFPLVFDPLADASEVKEHYGLELCAEEELVSLDAVVAAVAHHEFIERFTLERMQPMFVGQKILIDVKSVYDRNQSARLGYCHWRL